MNPHGPQHYQTYSELSSPSSPTSDTSPFNGHPAVAGAGPTAPAGSNPSTPHHAHHPHHHMDPHPHLQPHPAFAQGGTGPGGPHHQHNHHHHINNNNNNNTNNNNNSVLGGAVKVCGGCGGKITERFLLHALDRYWHNACLKCSCCQQLLADLGGSCYIKGNMILCKADYFRLFGNAGACSGCNQVIPANELVMRIGGSPPGGPGGPGGPMAGAGPGGPGSLQVFHLKCFSCSKCGSQLCPGDRFSLLSGSLVCEQDWNKMLKGGAGGMGGAAPTTAGVRKGKVGRPRRSRD